LTITVDVDQYRRAAHSLQTSAKLHYEYSQKSRSPYGIDNRREKTSAIAKQSTADKGQTTNIRPSYPRKDATYQRGDKRSIVRTRKCKNYSNCHDDGEHFDYDCKWRGTPGQHQSKRSYYGTTEDDDDDGDPSVELRDPDDEMEMEYERHQDAHFASLYHAERAFMGTTMTSTTSKLLKKQKHQAKRISPKPSQCRKCRSAFPSRNQLHQHLMATAHNVSTSKAVIESARSADSDLGNVNGLASFHYAKAEFQLTETTDQTATACIDSGYGNSTVDEGFLANVTEPTYRALEVPVIVKGIGGAKVTCTRVAIFSTYWPTIDGRLAKITRPYHIFPNLGCDLLVGIDTIYVERIDLFFSSAIPQMRIGNCDAASVRITVFKKELFNKVPVRAAKRTIVPANSTAVVPIKIGRLLPPNQDYLFTPSKLKTISTAGAGAPHGLFTSEQRAVLFTNLNDTPLTIFHNTILGHVESVQKAHHAAWEEATNEVNAFLGATEEAPVTANRSNAYLGTKGTFDPDADSDMPIPLDSSYLSSMPTPAAGSFSLGDGPPPLGDGPPPDLADVPLFGLGDGPPPGLGGPIEPPRPRPVVATTPCPDAGLKCAQEDWTEPAWLYTTYQPQYEYDLPKGIIVPTVETTTYKLVVINEDDDVSPEQIQALQALVARHPTLFNDGMGCVREPIEDWLRLPVDKDHELIIQAGRPYNVSKRGERAIDTNFDALRAHGRLETPKRSTPWGLKVFEIYKLDKERPVIDMRLLNAALPGDSYPLPKMEDIIEPLSGMRWLGTVDITSAFYQRLLHPDDRHRAAVVTHRGVEQFATSVMGGKTSVQHQQRLMDRRLIAQLSWRGASCYVDDIVIYAPTFQEFLSITDEVFRILSDLGITLKAKKCFLGFHSVELLGYLVDRLGLTTTESKAEAVQNIPFPTTLAQLEHFIGLTNWNRHLIPYYAQRVAPLQTYKTTLLKGAPILGRARKQYAAKSPVIPDDTLKEAFEDLKATLAARPRINHVVDGQPIYAFLDSSREYGTGLAVYQLTGDPAVYNKARLVPLHFMSRKLTPAEENYWPTDMEMSGLVWAVKKLRPYMERAYIWFVTDHKPNVDIFDMKSLVTTSTARSNLRLQTWGIYLTQFWGRMSVLYSKGSKIDCPDALSRLQYDISSRAQAFRRWAQSLGKEPDTAEFEVMEAFTMTAAPEPTAMNPTLALAAPTAGSPNLEEQSITDSTILDEQPITDSDSTTIGLTLVPSKECAADLKQAVLDSSRFTAIHNRLKEAEKSVVDGVERYILPDTCQYELHDGILYLRDPMSGSLQLVLAGPALRKRHLTAAHTAAHHGYARMADDMKPYYWPAMAKDIRRFLRHCPQCLRNKPANHKPFGLLSPIPAPNEPFDTWSIDLVTDLPPCAMRNTSIMVDTVMTVTDKFNKAVKFLPGRKDWSAADWATSVHEGVSLNG
jgi:hypothetical protein